MNDIEVVFFDAGDTLLCPQPSFPELAARTLGERGHPVTGDEVVAAGRAVGHHFRRAADEGWVFSASADESLAFWTALYTEMLEELGIDDPGGPARLYEVFSDLRNYGLFADARATLHDLREAGYRLGVISNFEGWLSDLLEHLDIKDLFDVLAISGPLGWEKPDERIFKWALEEAGVAASACVHVGDQPYFDAEAAIECGLHGVLIDRYGRWTDIDADYPKISGLAELPDVVRELGT